MDDSSRWEIWAGGWCSSWYQPGIIHEISFYLTVRGTSAWRLLLSGTVYLTYLLTDWLLKQIFKLQTVSQQSCRISSQLSVRSRTTTTRGKVRPTNKVRQRHNVGHLGENKTKLWTLAKMATLFNNIKLECGPMPNLMVALPNTGGALCSTLQSLADAHY